MKFYTTVLLLSLALGGCASQQQQVRPQQTQLSKSPANMTIARYEYEHNSVGSAFKDFFPYREVENIAILSKPPQSVPYTKLGEVSVNHINQFGIKRQMAAVHELLQKEAIALGGDAILPCKKKGDTYVARVIKFDKPHA